MQPGNPFATDAIDYGKVWRWFQLAAAAVVLCLILVPTRWVESGPRLCLIKHLTGHECLGCGMTRGASALMHGDATKAAGYNKGAFLVVPMLVGLAACSLRRRS